jgi:hypothetical protein
MALLPPFLLLAATPPAFLPSPSPSLPSPVSFPMPVIKLSSPTMAAHHGRPQPSLVFFEGQQKWMCTTFLLLSLSSILSEMNSNLRILWDFIFSTKLGFFL